MTIPPTRREVTHERILAVAARTLRRNGYAGVGVADVMKQAGLTHGGFYAHFASREALLAEAMAHAGRESAVILAERMTAARDRGDSAFKALIETYLADEQLKTAEFGCVVAALGSEMPRQSPELLQTAAERVRKLIALVQRTLPAGGSKEQAMVIAGTMVGTLQLGRTLGFNAQGKALLAATRNALLSQHDQP